MEHLEPFRDHELSVTVSELLVATADSSDPLLDDSVSRLLHAMRLKLEMDVVFVSEFIEGRRMFRYLDTGPGAPDLQAGESSPVEETVCQQVVEKRVPELVQDLRALPQEDMPDIPFRIGAHLSTPIMLEDQRIYGTLCCFSAAPRPDLVQADLDKLRLCAKIVARKVDLASARGIVEPAPDWKLQPMDKYDSPLWQKVSKRTNMR